MTRPLQFIKLLTIFLIATSPTFVSSTPADVVKDAAALGAMAVYVASPDDKPASHDLYLMFGNGQTRRLTFDGRPKQLPVFSPKGDFIAYNEIVNHRVGDTKLVVIDLSGKLVAKTLVNKFDENSGFDHIDYLETTEWVGPNEDRILVYGPMQNLTAAVGYIEGLSISDKKFTGDEHQFKDFAGSYAVSPNGQYVATETGIEQFNHELQNFEMPLEVNNYPFNLQNTPYVMVSPLAWSADSRHLSVVIRDSNLSGATKLVTATFPPQFKCAHMAAPKVLVACASYWYTADTFVVNPPTFGYKPFILPPAVSRVASWNSFYINNDLYVLQYAGTDPLAPGAKTTRFAGGNPSVPEAVAAGTLIDPAYVAPTMRQRLFSDLLLAGPHLSVADADIWCGTPACGPLATEPRRNPEGPSSIIIPDLNLK